MSGSSELDSLTQPGTYVFPVGVNYYGYVKVTVETTDGINLIQTVDAYDPEQPEGSDKWYMLRRYKYDAHPWSPFVKLYNATSGVPVK